MHLEVLKRTCAFNKRLFVMIFASFLDHVQSIRSPRFNPFRYHLIHATPDDLQIERHTNEIERHYLYYKYKSACACKSRYVLTTHQSSELCSIQGITTQG
jgi:hypothetical protein